MVISDTLYILQHFDSNFFSFFIVNTLVSYNYGPTSPSRLYCENFELAWKETIDKSNWNRVITWISNNYALLFTFSIKEVV